MDQWSNVTFEGSRFKAPVGAPAHQALVDAFQPQNLELSNCYFVGYEGEGGELRTRGLLIRGGLNISVRHSTFEIMAGSNSFILSNGVQFIANRMTRVREGVQFKGGGNILIESNRFDNFQPFLGDHPDAIQFFTAGLTNPTDLASHDVLISGNLIIAADQSQGIFLADQNSLQSSGRGYKRIAIRRNIIVGAVWHGITAAPVDSLTIVGNRAIRQSGRDVRGNRITAAGREVILEDNEASEFKIAQSVRNHGNRTLGPLSAQRINAVIAEWTQANHVQ
ncbi:right-handed parallel beta-helix repeat-containing protein [Sphingomonas sp. CGMCC 1.13658]|nr:right-handed parallel beta-helix repeat-containing protein [Sphingomonas sp. CGMCC 1.13658]